MHLITLIAYKLPHIIIWFSQTHTHSHTYSKKKQRQGVTQTTFIPFCCFEFPISVIPLMPLINACRARDFFLLQQTHCRSDIRLLNNSAIFHAFIREIKSGNCRKRMKYCAQTELRAVTPCYLCTFDLGVDSRSSVLLSQC